MRLAVPKLVSPMLLAAATVAATSVSQEPADRMWTGGTILTMDDEAMRAEAVAEKDGRILAVGATDAVIAHKGPDAEMIDLDDRALLPGFVDAHGHMFTGGL